MKLLLETERLTVRTCHPSDAAELTKIRNTDFVTRYNLYRPVRVAEYLAELSSLEENGREYLTLLTKGGERPIGSVVLSEDSYRYHVDSVYISAWLAEEFANRGYMTEALRAVIREIFLARGHALVSCGIMAENLASLRMVEKLGFTREGVLRSAVRTYDGRVHDLVLFSYTREEFLAKYGA